MILIGLGSSLPYAGLPPVALLKKAFGQIRQAWKQDQTSWKFSPIYRSRPLAPRHRDDPFFVNAVLMVSCGPGPWALLRLLRHIEAAAGRERCERNAPRTLDLDILCYHGTIALLQAEEAGISLRLPHPGMMRRDFVLRPLFDIAPHWRHPVSGAGPVQALRQAEKTIRGKGHA